MEIKSISIVTTGKGVFETDYALVKTIDGKEFIYRFGFDNQIWIDLDDYLDNVRSDFEKESDCDKFGEEDGGLFYKKELWV